MKVTILNPKRVVYEGDAKSVFLPGDESEYELLDYHAPLIGRLRKGEIILDWSRKIPIRSGIVRFDDNACVILIEE